MKQKRQEGIGLCEICHIYHLEVSGRVSDATQQQDRLPGCHSPKCQGYTVTLLGRRRNEPSWSRREERRRVRALRWGGPSRRTSSSPSSVASAAQWTRVSLGALSRHTRSRLTTSSIPCWISNEWWTSISWAALITRCSANVRADRANHSSWMVVEVSHWSAARCMESWAMSQFMVCILQSAHLKGGYIITLRGGLSQFCVSPRTLQMHTSKAHFFWHTITMCAVTQENLWWRRYSVTSCPFTQVITVILLWGLIDGSDAWWFQGHQDVGEGWGESGLSQ